MFKLIILLARKNRILESLLLMFSNIFLSNQNQNVLRWKLVNGDKSLRINYPLNSNSVAFDVGGYVGNWSSDIYQKYRCYIYAFEPIPEYYRVMKKALSTCKKNSCIKLRFSRKNKIYYSPFGKRCNIGVWSIY